MIQNMSRKWDGAVGLAWASLRHAAAAGTGLVIVKSAVAATMAWVAAELLGASSATFAPFTAVLMMHATVSRSIDHALRYTASMLGGIVLAGLLSPLLGPAWWTFGLLVVLSLVLGRWRWLGAHGPQVAVAAMFAYATLVQPTEGRFSWGALASIAGMVLLGAVIALAVNFALLPPLRYRAAQNGVRTLSREVTALLCDVADGLQGSNSADQQAEEWTERADELSDRAVAVRRSVDDAAESMRWNPRRWLVRRKGSFEGYRGTVRGLHRIANQLRMILTDLSYQDDIPSAVTSNAAGVLTATAEVTSALGELHSEQELDRLDEVDSQLHEGEQRCRTVAEHVEEHRREQPGEWLSSDALHTDLRRLIDECSRVRDELNTLRRQPTARR